MKSKLIVLFATLALAAIPTFAEETLGSTPDAAEVQTAEVQTVQALAVEAEAVSTETEVNKDFDFEVLSLLGFTSVFDTSYYRPGYCYHDCSACNSREDCKEPGMAFGFPCTEIRLC